MQNNHAHLSEHEKDLERIRNFRLMDDEFMSAVLSDNPAATELVLRIILDDPTLVVEYSHTQESIKNLFGKDVVLDVFCTDNKGNSFNVEIQRSDQGAAPKRARYHASLVDSKLLPPGHSYADLPESYVIFITENDYFGYEKPLYHVDRTVLEPALPFDDAQHIIYVNGQHNSDTPLGRLIHDFWCTQSRDMHYDVLRESVSYYKDNKEGTTAMCRSLEEMRNEYEQKGEAIGKAIRDEEKIKEMLASGKDPEAIIDFCQYPADLVYEVAATLA